MSHHDRSDADIEAALAVLRGGGLVAFPTETVYGLGADARNASAVARIFAAKGRPADHPLIVHLASASQLAEWAVDVPRSAWQLAEAFWPGPLSMVVPRAPGVLDAVTGGQRTVALRVPDHPRALALLEAFGSGIAGPSANRYGRVSPTRAAHVHEELGDRVDLVLDGGPCAVGIESTIVDLSSTTVQVLRPGAVTAQAIAAVLGTGVDGGTGSSVRTPGRVVSHYAPNARVVLTSDADVGLELSKWLARGLQVGLLASVRPVGLDPRVVWFGDAAETDDPTAQARHLYDRLRMADACAIELLVAVLPGDAGVGHALCDRLRRAAGQGDGSAS